MKKSLLIFLSSCAFTFSYAQNYITNGDFEQLNNNSYNPNNSPTNFFSLYVPNWSNGCPAFGSQGTPDIFSTQNTDCLTKIPANAWANNLPVRAAGNKYAGMWGAIEALRCGINQPLQANQLYTLSFYVHRNQGHFVCSTTGGGPTGGTMTVKATLKRSADPCNGGIDIVISQAIPFGSWENVTGTFTLTTTQASQGYDRIEFKTETGSNLTYFFLDDVALYPPAPIVNFDFVTLGQTYVNVVTPYGLENLTRICAYPAPAETPVLINGGATSGEYGYGIQIQEFDPGNYIGGTVVYNSWQTGAIQVPTTDINIQNLAGVNLQIGQIYMVTVYAGSLWAYKSKLVQIVPSPTLNAGADGIFCSYNGINVTSSNWPVQVQKNNVSIGSFSSSPIVLPVSASANYTFTTTNSYGCSVQDNANLTIKLCSEASFVFRNPLATNIINGQIITDICSPYVIDGSASTNENAYHLRVQQFNPNTGTTIGAPLFDNWYCSCPAGNYIDLYTVTSGGIVYGNTYLVILSVGPDWDSESKYFRAIDCTKSGEITMEEVSADPELPGDISVFPNPAKESVTVLFNNQQVSEVTLMNALGETVFSKEVSAEESSAQLNLETLPGGVYMICVKQNNGSQTVKKLLRN